MATAALAAGGTALSGLLNALGNQGSRGSEVIRPTMEPVLPSILAADKKKLCRVEKQIGNQRLYNLLLQPEVLGLLITFGGMFAANKIPFSSKKAENEALQAVAVTASVLLGLGYAGIGDLTTLIIALGAGGISALGGFGGGNGGLISGPGGTSVGIPGQGWSIPLLPGLNLYP